MPGRLIPHLACACLALVTVPGSLPQSKSPDPAPVPLTPETITYSIEWRLIPAGTAKLTIDPNVSSGSAVWLSKLHLETIGLVSKLYKLEDNYDLKMERDYCALSTTLDAMERSRHRETKVNYNYPDGKAAYVERDLIKNSVVKTAEVDIPSCTSDIIGALFKLRTLKLEPGQSAQLPLSDGKKSVSARVEAQQREQVKTDTQTFNTIRYEAFVFGGVLYARKAQLLIWLTDDARRLPVQIRLRLSFPIGTVTLQLEKEERS